jgi:hypothetical protein
MEMNYYCIIITLLGKYYLRSPYTVCLRMDITYSVRSPCLDLRATFHIYSRQSVGMLSSQVHTKLHITSFNGQSVIAAKLKTK